jgi:cytochrome c peroxidase
MRTKSIATAAASMLVAGALSIACSSPSPTATPPAAPAVEQLPLPADPANYAPNLLAGPMAVPADNPITVEKATLGWQLWFDTRLSGKGDRSCYSCHVNEKGLTDGLVKNTGAVDGKPLARHTPTLWNIGYHTEWYWDGRAKALEGQALAAWKLANMGAKDPEADKIRDDVIARINAVPSYAEQFKKVFGGPADEKNVSQALATFMRTIVSRDTAFDRFTAGDQAAMSDAAKRGWETFQKAECNTCHRGVLFTDLKFHNVGIGVVDGKPTDVGRFTVTKEPKDTGAFKTPTLRDVGRSAPYFHDGSVATLQEAVTVMANGGIANPFLDRENLKKRNLSAAEIADVVEFLKALDEPARIKEPKVP